MQTYINKVLKLYNRLNTPLDEDITANPTGLFLDRYIHSAYKDIHFQFKLTSNLYQRSW